MPNSENDPLSLPFASKDATTVDNKLFVAATLAAVVLAGSAIAYRHVATNPASAMRLFWKDSRGFEGELENEKNVEGTVGPDAKIGVRTASTSTTTYATGQELEHNATTGTSKHSRPKDRRKRGKDPLKEALKSGKKLKSLPNPPCSSSVPSSPTSTAATLPGKEKRVGENMKPSFESTRAHPLDASHVSPESQRVPTKGIQHERSPLTPVLPAIHLSAAAGHSRDVSQHSCSTHDEEDDLAGDGDADVPGTSSYRQYVQTHLQSPNSLSHSSLSLPHSLSSLADISEGEPGDGGWVTSVSKSRSKHRARLEDVMFEDVGTGSGRLAHDGLGKQAGDDGMAITKEKTRGYIHQEPEVTESCSNSTIVFEGTSMFPPNGAPISFLSTDSPLHVSCSDANSDTGELYKSTAPCLPQIDPSSEKRTEDPEQEKDKKLSLPLKGSGGTSCNSCSSAVTGRGGKGSSVVIGQCQTVSVTAAVASRMSVFGSGLTENEACPSPPMRAENGGMEFTFPTLNSQAATSSSGHSTRARSTLIDASVSSVPPKKNKKFVSNKNGTPPNPPSSRPSSPSNSRENHTQGPNASTPALSAQTQLASLRGALEAARLREEKHKTELEKAAKELEMLKWESANSRRGEVELQAQVRQLTHQLQNYATLFASVAPHLNSQFALEPRPQGSSPKIDPQVELPNGGVDPSTSESPEHEKVELQEAATSDKAQGQNHIPASPLTQQPLQLPSSPPSANDINSPLVGAQQHPLSPPSSASIPAFFPYYLPTQHPHFPIHHSPWVYHPYQPQHSTQNLTVPAAPSSPPPPRHYTNVHSPTMYPISPVPPPLSPQSIGMMSPQILHQYQSFGFGGGLRSAGASSTGSHSPETTDPSGFGTGLNRPRPRIRRRKSQLASLNGNARAGWEDIGDGWIGLSKVAMQPTATNVVRTTDEGAMADGECEDDNVETANSPYSELLADAILKRSSTIRPSKKNGKKENDHLVGQEGAEDVEPYTEFTFPSLTNVSNDYDRTASRTESSVSSSLSSSPPSTTATVPDLIGDPGWEEDKASLPPVVENAEDSDPLVPVVELQGTRCEMPLSKVQDTTITQEATSKKEEHEQPVTDSEQ